jgi:hypothetical protein
MDGGPWSALVGLLPCRRPGSDRCAVGCVCACQAWEIYCSVFRQISKHLAALKSLDLRHVAPALLQAKNLQLAVPGGAN